ncbi:Nn.00g028550.m01.CDS01 [Neocucurbitaria sp. VM-36]
MVDAEVVTPTANSCNEKRIIFLPFSTALRHNEERSKEMPPHIYRVTFEKTATPSQYEGKDLHISEHRKLRDENAFQALATFSCEADLTRDRIRRHHKQTKKKDPSSYVSVTNSLAEAAGRCRWHYYESARKGRRLSVVEISTSGLVPAEFETSERMEDGSPIKIPIWVRDVCRPPDGSPITTQEFKASGADLYVCVLEQWYGGFRLDSSSKHGQWHEFMAGGFIQKKYVTRVLPYDGHILHRKKGETEVRSLLAKDYVFDWEVKQWHYDPLSRKRDQPMDEEENLDETLAIDSPDGHSRNQHRCPTCGHKRPTATLKRRRTEKPSGP